MWRFDLLMGMVGTLVISYGLDRWIQSFRDTGFRTFNMTPYLWASTGANLVMGILLLTLAWLVNFSGKRSVTVSLIYLLLGLLLTLLPLLLTAAPPVFDLLSAPALRPFRLTLLYSAPTSRLLFTSAFIAACGGLGLILDRKTW